MYSIIAGIIKIPRVIIAIRMIIIKDIILLYHILILYFYQKVLFWFDKFFYLNTIGEVIILLLLILEIVLTICVWKHGYKWKALIPVAIAFFSAFFVSLTLTLMGLSLDTSKLFLVDILAIIALIVMLNTKLSKEETPPPSNS